MIAHLVGAFLAALCYRRQVRYAVQGAERWIWPVFVLLLGLPGWVGYLYCRRWPVLERCPSCNAVVPKNSETCARCRNEFPLPARLGTEIFA